MENRRVSPYAATESLNPEIVGRLPLHSCLNQEYEGDESDEGDDDDDDDDDENEDEDEDEDEGDKDEDEGDNGNYEHDIYIRWTWGKIEASLPTTRSDWKSFWPQKFHGGERRLGSPMA